MNTSSILREIKDLLMKHLSEIEVRAFVQDLPDQMHLTAQLPGQNASLYELVESAVDTLHRRGVLEELIFSILPQRRHDLSTQVEALRRRLAPRIESGVYGVILLHQGSARYRELHDWVCRVLGASDVQAGLVIEEAPVLLCEGLSHSYALELGRQLELLGAQVSFKFPRDAPPLPRYWRSPSGILLAEIQAGAYTRRSNGQHVTLSRPYRLMAAPVIQQLYEGVTGHNPSRFRGRTRPVDSISRDDALRFCELLSSREGLNPGYQLPTEAEWENAALAGGTTLYAGSNRWPEVGWGGTVETYPVQGRLSNAWGLYDMTGNIAEWVLDPHPQADEGGGHLLTGPPPRTHAGMLKGGGYAASPEALLVTARLAAMPDERKSLFGMRLLLPLPTNGESR